MHLYSLILTEAVAMLKHLKMQDRFDDWSVSSLRIYFLTKFIEFKVNSDHVIIKGIVNMLKCIVELYEHVGIFKNMREVLRETQAKA